MRIRLSHRRELRKLLYEYWPSYQSSPLQGLGERKQHASTTLVLETLLRLLKPEVQEAFPSQIKPRTYIKLIDNINTSICFKSNTIKTGCPPSRICALLKRCIHIHTNIHTQMHMHAFALLPRYISSCQHWPSASFVELDLVCTLTCTLSIISRLKSQVHSQARLSGSCLKSCTFDLITHSPPSHSALIQPFRSLDHTQAQFIQLCPSTLMPPPLVYLDKF